MRTCGVGALEATLEIRCNDDDLEIMFDQAVFIDLHFGVADRNSI
jgi:hypothetical protein